MSANVEELIEKARAERPVEEAVWCHACGSRTAAECICPKYEPSRDWLEVAPTAENLTRPMLLQRQGE